MSEEIVKIKGTKTGLQIVFDKGTEFDEVERDILGKLESGSQFFYRGTVVSIDPGLLNDEDTERLSRMFRQHGMLLRIENSAKDSEKVSHKAVVHEEKKNDDVQASPQQMTVLNRTLRSGQELRCEGGCLIVGNVNPGAQVIAGGSIDIRGTCRGIVHAGAFGDYNAFIVADRLMPVQIRIANLIAQPPDQSEQPDYPERASIRDGRIIIEPVERKANS